MDPSEGSDTDNSEESSDGAEVTEAMENAQEEEISVKRTSDLTSLPKHVSKKMRRNELYKPPTAEELNNLKEAETMFHSSLFRLQIDELMTEVKMKPKLQSDIRNWLQSLKTFLMDLPESDIYELHDNGWIGKGLKVPISMVPKNSKAFFKFMPPSELLEVGSFAIGTVCAPKATVDVALRIPKKCWLKSDYLNHIYHRKRALYITCLAKAFKGTALVDELKFSLQDNCHMKPVLLITPKGKLGKHCVVRLLPFSDQFKLNRFIPQRNNVRKSWFYGTDQNLEDDANSPTPFYNSTILMDLLMPQLTEFLKQTLTSQSVKDGIILLKVWFYQRDIFGISDVANGFIITMIVAYLLTKHKINNLMSSYQVFRTTISFLRQENWPSDGITLYNNQTANNQSEMPEFQENHEVVFIEPSGFLNVCFSFHKYTLLRINQEAELALKILDFASSDSFTHLFMTKVPFCQKFDYRFQLLSSDMLKEYCEKLGIANSVLDHGGDCIISLIPHLCSILKKGLGDRIELMGNMIASVDEWHINKPAPDPNAWKLVSIGILQKQECVLNNMIKGPTANSAESRNFREFWGEKSDLRRFQDGSIHEAVVWSAENVASKRTVLSAIIKYILEKHVGVSSEDIVFIGNDLYAALHPQKQALSERFSPYGSGEEFFMTMFNAFNSLSLQLRKLEGLPLSISSIQGVSSVFRFSEVFPPFPREHKCRKQMIITDNSCVSFGEDYAVPHWVPLLEVVINFESSGKWPDNIEAIKRVKAAMHLKIADLLLDKFDLCAKATVKYVDVLKDGYIFRLVVACHKEIGLLKQSKNPDGMIILKNTSESQELEKRTEILPKLNSVLHGLHQQHNTFGTACRLAKRWLTSHLLHSYIDEIVVDLIMAHIYLYPEPFTCPSSSQLGFHRFLALLHTHDWKANPLIVNFNNELAKPEIADITSEMAAQRSNLPEMLIVTPFDKSGMLFTKESPVYVVLNRLIALAKGSQETLEKAFLEPLTADFKQIFRTPLVAYDVLIHLKPGQIPKNCFSLEDLKGAKCRAIKPYQKKPDEKMPIVGFDPVEFYLQDLKASFSEFALFFYDTYGGSYIAVVWKPSAFEPRPFKVSHINGRVISGANADGTCNVVPNVEAIIECFEKLGEGLVKRIENLTDRWTIS